MEVSVKCHDSDILQRKLKKKFKNSFQKYPLCDICSASKKYIDWSLIPGSGSFAFACFSGIKKKKKIPVPVFPSLSYTICKAV